MNFKEGDIMMQTKIQNIEEPKTYRRKKSIVILGIFYLLVFTFTCLGFIGYTSKVEYPQTIKIQQLFKKGDIFNYKISETNTTIMEGSGKIGSQGSAILSLKVIRINKDKTVDIVIAKESGSTTIKSEILGTRTTPDPDIDKQIKIRLYPSERPEVLSGDLSLVVWSELIPQEFPTPDIKVGDSLTHSQQLSKEAGEIILKYSVIGFEKVKGFDCVKVEIESTGDIRRKTERGPQIFSVKMEKELYLAYKEGYPIIKSHTISKTRIGTAISTKETTVELLK